MSKTFRLFVSSTFSDFRVERDILHKEIFPEVEAYAKEKGCEFQPVDLRWGINAEAQNDQKTLELCLEEVRACKSLPYPNFLILAGDRYGWVPLPFYIEKTEFEKIENGLKDEKQKDLLDKWYILDENHIPASYRLQERAEKYIDWSIWDKEEKRLRDILQAVVKSIFTCKDKDEKDKEVLDNEEYYKYFLSATEQEAIEGIENYRWETFNQKDEEYKKRAIDKEYVIALFRDLQISKGADKHEKLNDFKEESKELNTLKEGLKNALKKELTLHVKPSLIEEDKELNVSYPKEEKDKFKKQLTKILKTQIDNELARTEDIAPLKQEQQEQLRYKLEKLKSFVGRANSIKKMEDYINNDSNTPFIVYGRSGMGKSSLMAKVIDKNELSNAIIYRFVGASANSTSIKTLQVSILEELIKNGVIEEFEFEEDSNKFNQQIRDILSKDISKKTVIFIDAIDQLKEKEYLTWLPYELHQNLKVIISALNDDSYEKDTHYFNTLRSKYKKAKENFLDISDDLLNEDEIEKAINSMLEPEHRTITQEQMEYVKKQCKKVDYSPLYLKIASQELKNWKSYDKKEDTELEDTVKDIIGEYIDNLSDIHHHEKAFVDKVFSYIHVSKYGLSEKELLNILSEDLEDDKEFREVMLNEFHDKLKKKNPLRDNKEELTLPISIWVRLQTQLKPFILETNTDGQNLMKFFHRQFTSVAEKRYKKQKLKTHRRVAEFFNEHQDKTKTWDERYNYVHSLSELPYHLYYSNQKKETKNLLLDLEFVGSVYDSQKEEDFKEILYLQEDEKLEMVKSFYREKEHLIKRVNTKEWRAHQSLFQLAYEDGLNSILTTKAEELLKQDKVNFAWLKREWREEEYSRFGFKKIIEGHNFIKQVENGSMFYSEKNNLSYLWSQNGKQLKKMKKSEHITDNTIKLQSGKLLLYTENNTIKLLDKDYNLIKVLENCGKLKEVIQLRNGNADFSNTTYELSNGNILTVTNDGLLKLWNQDGKLINTLKGHKGSLIEIIQLKYNDNFLSYNCGNFYLWDKNGQLINILKNHWGSYYKIVELENSNIFTYSNETIRLWNNQGEIIKTVKERQQEDYTEDMKYLGEALSEFDDTGDECLLETNLYIINQDNNDTINMKDDKQDEYINQQIDDSYIESIDDGEEIFGIMKLKNGNLISIDTKTISWWNQNGDEIATTEKRSGGINNIFWLKNGNMICCGKILNQNGELLNTLEHSSIDDIAELSNENIITCSSYGNYHLYSKNGKLIKDIRLDNNEKYTTMELSDKNILLYSSGKIYLLNESGETIISIPISCNYAIECENKNILLCTENIYIWNPNQVIQNRKKYVKTLMATKLQNGNIFSYTEDKTIHIINQYGKLLKIIDKKFDNINKIIHLKNKNILAFSENTENDENNTLEYFYTTMYLFDAEGKFITTMNGQAGHSIKIIELDNGNLLSYTEEDYQEHTSNICLWNQNGKSIKKIDENKLIRLKNGNILTYLYDLRYEPQFFENTPRIWTQNGQLVIEMQRNIDNIQKIVELENGDFFASNDDEKCCMWSKDGKSKSITEDELSEMLDEPKILSFFDAKPPIQNPKNISYLKSYNFTNDDVPHLEIKISENKFLIAFGPYLSIFTVIN